MKKEMYETPSVEILMFDTVEVLCASSTEPPLEPGEGDLDFD